MVGPGWHVNCGARAYRFNSSGGLVDLGSTVAGSASRANACNSDGTVIAGWQDSNSGARQGAVWTNGVQRIITTQAGATAGEGYLWINGTITPLETLAAQAGITLTPDIRMALPLGMSRDGYTIVGTARTAAGVQGFILDLPRPAQCPADFNDDGAVNGDDLGVLLGAWGACGAG